MIDTFATIAVDSSGITLDDGCHFEGRKGQSAYKSPSFMASHKVIEDQADSPLEPVPPKQAEATSKPTASDEKPLFLPNLSGAKFSSSEDPVTSFLRSTASDGLSEDHLFSLLNSQRRTMASAVTVTKQFPATPQGCHNTSASCD